MFCKILEGILCQNLKPKKKHDFVMQWNKKEGWIKNSWKEDKKTIDPKLRKRITGQKKVEWKVERWEVEEEGGREATSQRSQLVWASASSIIYTLVHTCLMPQKQVVWEEKKDVCCPRKHKIRHIVNGTDKKHFYCWTIKFTLTWTNKRKQSSIKTNQEKNNQVWKVNMMKFSKRRQSRKI